MFVSFLQALNASQNEGVVGSSSAAMANFFPKRSTAFFKSLDTFGYRLRRCLYFSGVVRHSVGRSLEAVNDGNKDRM